MTKITLPNNVGMTIPLRDGGKGEVSSSDPALVAAQIEGGHLQLRCGSPRTGSCNVQYTPQSGAGQKEQFEVEVGGAWNPDAQVDLTRARFQEPGGAGQQRA